MQDKKLISVDFYSHTGMLKKPDTNDPVYLTFNMLHKPAVLGIIGAILGISGFPMMIAGKENVSLPAYWEKLKDLKIGIKPLRDRSGNFQKIIITYNNTTGLASKEKGGNLIVSEQTLIFPAFRVFILLDRENELHKRLDEYLRNYKAEFLPYLGKNEHYLWWKNYREYDYELFEPKGSFRIESIFIKSEPLKYMKEKVFFDPLLDTKDNQGTFSYFERLPVGYVYLGKNKHKKDVHQYDYRDFVYTNFLLKAKSKIEYTLLKLANNEIIQVF